MIRMSLRDHFWTVTYIDEDGYMRDELFDNELEALRFAGGIDADAHVCPPIPASVFVGEPPY